MSNSETHSHAVTRFGRAFAIGIALNVTFVLVEAIYGWRSGSLALLADAGHNLSDVGGLALAWGALAVSRLQANDRHTYGWRRATVLASFLNAVILLVTAGALAWEAIQRLQDPSPVQATTVMVVAGIGVIINAVTALLFMSGKENDLNIRGAFLHMTADALVSLGVVVAGALYLWKGWLLIDPLVSLVIVAAIIVGTASLFRQSLHALFEGVPEHIDLKAVRQCLSELPGVLRVHDLHVWSMDASEPALTAHLVLRGQSGTTDELLDAAIRELRQRFAIEHATLQLESEAFAKSCPRDAPACAAAPEA
ncbi:MAG: cation diffusion facilitator family transporter [Steroidobacteraceae bacterium]